MKLRIKGNSVRLRLTRSEVEILEQQGEVTEQTNFGTTVLTYRLTQTDKDILTASFKQQELFIEIPTSFVKGWTENNLTGLDNKQGDGTPPSLYILVEKDFKCIDNNQEDQSDNYENPKTC